jgi:hypothetical protein
VRVAILRILAFLHNFWRQNSREITLRIFHQVRALQSRLLHTAINQTNQSTLGGIYQICPKNMRQICSLNQ